MSNDPAPAPRLCHLVKWPDFDGYGFNLHAEKSRTGQFIGKVDDGSPAQLAGLREGDRIVEVNGVNIANENHRQVVERIKAVATETKLLVVDEAADRYYKERKVVVKSTMPSVLCLETPVPRPSQEPPSYENVTPNGNTYENGDSLHDQETPEHEGKENGSVPHANGSVEKRASVAEEEAIEPQSSPKVETKVPDSPVRKPKEEANSHSRSSTPLDSAPDSPGSTHSSRSSQGRAPALEDGMLNLNMSASEMRQMLANRRRKDPKKEPMDIRQKYEIIQQM